MSNEKRHVFLIGPSGVGKTTVAKIVGEQLHREVVDLDDYITEKISMPISQFFAEKGEAEFRQVEREAIHEMCIETEPRVYATGGGTVLDTKNIIEMKNHGYVMYLNAFEADLVERIENDQSNSRPLLEGDLATKIHEQFVSRRECYELAADVTIGTSRRDEQAVAESVVRQFQRESGRSRIGSASIVVGDNLLGKFSSLIGEYPTAVLISQESIPQEYRTAIVASLENDGTKVIPINVVYGEPAKSFETYIKVIEEMSEAKVTRNSCVVALGGGVVGDLSGFIASTYHRGIDVIQVPTTLLAQVDSSIGGKCGINLRTGKNLVGTFHQPKTIIADTQTLSTLPENDFKSGLGEVAKYALLGNTTVSNIINDSAKAILARDNEVLVPLIRSCMNHKLQVVARDPYERIGIRATLNLGHTLAHAIETATDYSTDHGIAVALGLRFAAKLSAGLGRIPESQAEESIALLDLLGLESEIPQECKNTSKMIDLMYSDKKSEGGLSFILLNVGGGAELVHDIDEHEVFTILDRFLNPI